MADAESDAKSSNEVEIVKILGSGWFKVFIGYSGPPNGENPPKRLEHENKVFFELDDEIQR